MRPIDADALKDELELADFETDSRMFGGQTVLFEDSVFKIVDSAPTISPDEVRGVGDANMYDRLAAYEDTGLEPEEIKAFVSKAEFLTRAEAEKAMEVNRE